jgi:hypothetical protein
MEEPANPAQPYTTAGQPDRLAEIRERKAERQAIRAEFARRRQSGLAARHRQKLAHWAEHGLPAELAELAAKVDARIANQLTEESDQ